MNNKLSSLTTQVPAVNHDENKANTDIVTPLFRIVHTEDDVFVHIRVPHCREAEMEVFVQQFEIYFESHPYFLHLKFPIPIYIPEDPTDPSSCSVPIKYNIDTGVAVISVKKQNHSNHFASIQVIPSLSLQSFDQENDINPSDIIEHTLESLDKQFEEDVVNIGGITRSLNEISLTRPKYGFAARYTGVFHVRTDDVSQIVQLPSPDSTPVWRRPSLRKAAEDKKFNVDHYIADYILQHEFQHVLDYRPDVDVTTKDSAKIEKPYLPNKQFDRDVDEMAAADLVGILYASAYDLRFTCGERNVESAWTISSLSATLSWLENMKSVRDAILAAYRRSLAYPFHRSCKLADLVLSDVKKFLCGDVNQVRNRLRTLLWELYNIFEQDSMLRLLCDIFLVDYCIWIETVPSTVLQKLQQEVAEIEIEKHELEWDLENLDQKAERLAIGEEIDEDDDLEEHVEGAIHQAATPIDHHHDKTGNGRELTTSDLAHSSPNEIITTMNPHIGVSNEHVRYGPPSENTESSDDETESSNHTSTPPSP